MDTFQGNGDEDDEEDDEDDDDDGNDELSDSELQVAGTRRRRPPFKYTPGAGALG